MRPNIWFPLHVLGLLLALFGSAAAQAAPAAVPEAVIFVPKTGAPLAAPVIIPLGAALAKDRTVSAEIVPGSLTDMPVSCPLAPAATVADAVTGTNAVAVTLSAPSVPCGGGHHKLLLRVTAQPAGEAPAVLAQTDVSLWIRFEPALDVTPANTQPADLKTVGCWTCLIAMRAFATSFLTPEVWTRSQSFAVKNSSIGSVSLRGEIVAQGSSPLAAAGAVKLSGAGGGELAPGATTTVTVEATPQGDLYAGAYDLRLTLTGAEAGGPPQPIQGSTAVQVRLSLRYGVSWALAALVAGLLVGRGIALIQDPVYASKLEFLDHLRMVRLHALAVGATGDVITQLGTLERTLDSIYGPIPDSLKNELASIETRLDPTLAAVRADATEAAPAPSLAQRGRRLVGWASWLLTGTQPPARVGADVIRPGVQLVIVLVGLFTGLRANYVEVATFGQNGILDLLPAVIWSAATVAVAKSLDAFAKR